MTSCPAEGDWIYLGGTMTRTSTAVAALINITVQDGAGYDLYMNIGSNCPTGSSSSSYVQGSNTTNRLATSAMFVSGSSGDDLTLIIGLQRRAGSPCNTPTVVMFDGSQSKISFNFSSSSSFFFLFYLFSLTPPFFLDGQNQPILACTAALDATTCGYGLSGWQIAVIVVGVVVGVALIAGLSYLLYRRFSSK